MALIGTVRLIAVLAISLSCLPSLAQQTANITADGPAASAASPLFDDSPIDRTELALPRLIADVQARNPSLAAMTAAWQAAAQRYPQMIALEDPTLMAMGAPASVGSDQVESAYAVQLNQKLPWFGKRAARGRQAQAETSEAYHDFEDSRLRLVEMTEAAFFDYYLANHHVQLNREDVELIRQLRDIAQRKYDSNQVTQQDVLQAEVEAAQLERRRIELDRMAKVSVARINTLLQRDPFSPLPPPPMHLDAPMAPMDVDVLQQTALSHRPDLAALADKIRAEQAAVTLACKDYYPDAEVFGRYDTFWQPASTQSDLRPQIGVTVNVPIYRGRLDAAVREATFKLNQQRADFEQQRLDVQFEVASAYAEVEEARTSLQLYSDKLLPATEKNVAAARNNYNVNKLSFLDLVTAQRQLIDLRESKEEELAVYHSRLAKLKRAVGGASPIAVSSGEELTTPLQP